MIGRSRGGGRIVSYLFTSHSFVYFLLSSSQHHHMGWFGSELLYRRMCIRLAHCIISSECRYRHSFAFYLELKQVSPFTTDIVQRLTELTGTPAYDGFHDCLLNRHGTICLLRLRHLIYILSSIGETNEENFCG